MIAKHFSIPFLVVVGLLHLSLNAQTVSDSSMSKKIAFYELRGNNAIDAGIGTSVINGDLSDPEFEIYFHIGYKRYIFPHLNINFSYNKFNLAFKDVYNEGFMSFDFNLETTLLPDKKFSPFIFAGAGYNASNYFEQTAMKFQGGGGLEYIVTDGFGIKLYTDYNSVMSDELDGIVAGASDDTYFRIGFGVNYYFGGNKKKEKMQNDQPSIINSNQIILHN
ncbi:MAG: Curli production assembly/transport component CsgG [Gelidibacter sp.]